ncbi:MAG: uridine kinase [Clostridiaceae bacterium]|nr:uridine kinase [Clostridiaceae bacterium]
MYIVGITGASGSGKTTLANRLLQRIEGRGVLISLDSYYRDFPNLPFEKRKALNFDAPDIFEFDLLEHDLTLLAEGKPAPRRVYNFVTHRRDAEEGFIEPHPVVILEGIHIFASPAIRDLCRLKVYVELDPDVCVLRRLKRDVEERGRDIDGVTLQYLKTVKPMYERYIRNYREWADIVVPTLIHSGIAAEMIGDYVIKHIQDERYTHD